MQFNALHRLHFGCSNGAYSEVTPREVRDSQVTLTDVETEIVVNHFGKTNIQRGNVASNRALASKNFILVSDTKPRSIKLNLVYPKPERDELRLYLRNDPFKPPPGDIWFIFEKDEALHIGAYSQDKWRAIGRADEEDEIYQSLIIDPAEEKLMSPQYQEIAATIRLKRNPRLAQTRFERAGYHCEHNADCRLFVARATHTNYLEAHHIIPVKFQDYFEHSLDTLENIIALCPYCHRAIHHAQVDTTKLILDTVMASRSALLDRYGISNKDLYDFYNCETIIRNSA